MTDPLLSVRDLTIELTAQGRAQTILSEVSFEVAPGQIVGIFGESGCGKTTLGMALLNLLPGDRYCVRGSIRLAGEELRGLDERRMESIRGRRISMIFQDPALSLNPVLRVRTQLAETARAHGAALDAARLLESVGLRDSGRILNAYPHQLSGGERQRVAIALALACHPPLAIADEPFTALDAPRAAAIARLFAGLKEATGTALLVISHSPGVLARIADSILVMRGGRIVEQGPPRSVFGTPADPYTAALVAAAEGLPARA